MIGFNYLGRLGRLGNQMFQYAALRGIAANRGYSFCLPYYSDGVDDGTGNILKTVLFNAFYMPSVTQLNIQTLNPDRKTVIETSFSFDELLFHRCPDFVNIHGFFQTEKYFTNVKDIIKDDFTFRKEIAIPCQEMMSEVNDDAVALHIRRKDFITNSNHTHLPLSYYKNALSEFSDTSPVLVFSDDPKWCHKQKLFEDDRFLISDDNQDYVDMCLMTMCKNHIISNSSFSWWGAWLSGSDNVIAPKLWFGKPDDEEKTKDVIPERWRRI